MIFYHNSRQDEYRCPQGAAPCGSRVRLRVRAEGMQNVTLRIWWESAEYRWYMRHLDGGMYEYEMEMPEKPGLLWYYFMAADERGQIWYLGNAADNLGGEGCCHRCEPASFQLTVYDPAFDTPAWMREGLMMQIMVDRFCNADGLDREKLPAGAYYHARWDDDPALVINDKRGNCTANDFFGGNLSGIREKLPYIRSLGVTALYLNPIFRAESNHKYDTGDYMQIDPSFGTEEDFRALCAEAKKAGVRIVLDGVFSHTGADSRYFDRYGSYGGHGAYCDPESPYRSWYSFEKWPDEYDSWWGFKTLPNVREEDPSYRKFIISGKDSVLAHWMRAGAGGWRLDVADELPMDFIRELRRREKELDPEAALIGEVWEDPSNKVAYGETRCYCAGDTLDATMNYPLRDAVLLFMLGRINAMEFVRRVQSMRENQPRAFFYAQMNLLGSHDKPRALTVLADVGNMEPERKYRYPIELGADDYARGCRRLIAAWNLICALPGMPCLYYGDEAGLYGMSDPYCRGTYPWGREDAALLDAFRAAALWRMGSVALKTGDMRLTAAGEDVVIVERFIHGEADVFGAPARDEMRAVAVNRADGSRWIVFDGKTLEVPAESALRLD